MHYVIIGTGPAGTIAAENIRKGDSNGKITLISDEGLEFYKREHLNRLIEGSKTEDDLFEKGRHYSGELNADFINGRVIDFDTQNKAIILNDQSKLEYDRLLIATGGKAYKLNVPGSQLEGIYNFYSLFDAKKVKQSLKNVKRISIIGGGSNSVKLAPILISQGKEVTIIEARPNLMRNMLDIKAAKIVEEVFKTNNISIKLDARVTQFLGNGGKISKIKLVNVGNIGNAGKVENVENIESELIDCDMAIVSIGIKPCIDILVNTGIKTDRGIIVDNYMQTNYEDIFAAGDIAQVPDPLKGGKHFLYPGWSEAKSEGKIAGMNMVKKDHHYIGDIKLNRMKFFGYSFISGGIIEPTSDHIAKIKEDSKNNSYFKFVFDQSNDHLIGGLVIAKDFDSKKWKKWLKNELLNPKDSAITPQNIFEVNFLKN